jgi:acetoin:2,6-dichlorophenolindophenol oxidoreductase subunit beta
MRATSASGRWARISGAAACSGSTRGWPKNSAATRIADTPISEACIMGAAVGAAMTGTRPIVEMRFSDFALCAIDELVNQAAKARYMFGGQMRVPMVVREPIGMWRSSAAQHSQSLESWYTHIPGLVVVAPSTPRRQSRPAQERHPQRRSGGLSRAQGPVGADRPGARGRASDAARQAEIVREGDAVTLVTWSAMRHVCAAAAEALAGRASRSS